MIIRYIYKGFTEVRKDNKIIKIGFISVLLASISFVTSCTSTGTPKLSENKIEKIIVGEASREDAVRAIGPPEQTIKLDKHSLNTYLYRVLSIKVSEDIFDEGPYEVWTYNKWSYFAVDPLLIPSRESSEFGLLIFNSSGICIKKFYAEAEHM